MTMKTIFRQNRSNFTVEVRSIFRRVEEPTWKRQHGRKNAAKFHGLALAHRRRLNKPAKLFSAVKENHWVQKLIKSHITLLGCTAPKFDLLSLTAARFFCCNFFSSVPHHSRQNSTRHTRYYNIMLNPWSRLGSPYTMPEMLKRLNSTPTVAGP